VLEAILLILGAASGSNNSIQEFLSRLSFDSWLACMYVTPSHRPVEILFRNGKCSRMKHSQRS
jgi:hypothetical protein